MNKILIYIFDLLLVIGKFLKIGNADWGMIRFCACLVLNSICIIVSNTNSLVPFVTLTIIMIALLFLDFVIMINTIRIKIGDRVYTNSMYRKKYYTYKGTGNRSTGNSEEKNINATKKWARSLLEVTETSDQTEILSAYRKMAKKYHPDLNRNDPNAGNNFKLVKQAYEALK